MTNNIPHTLICTVGTSLFKPNLFGLSSVSEDNHHEWLAKQPKDDQPHLSFEFVSKLKSLVADTLKHPLDQQDWRPVAQALSSIPGSVRLCGAEINSVYDLIQRNYCANDCSLFFCHSATDEGLQIATILKHYYELKRLQVKPEKIDGLQDKDPKLFRTKGLRNLAKTLSKIIREKSSRFCAINATGGYKAQIAIAVLMGQALGVSVYYKHEQFSEIIAFPPMPISLDFNLWIEKSGWLTALERMDMVEWQEVEEDWNEQMEALVERVEMNGKIYLELSPTGQIFHETFKGRFESDRDRVLPPSVPTDQKKPPDLTSHGWGNARTPILNFLQKITDECVYVHSCRTHYWNKHLSCSILFRPKGEEIEGIFSNGTWTVKFIVETSSSTQGQRAACVADLNNRIGNWS